MDDIMMMLENLSNGWTPNYLYTSLDPPAKHKNKTKNEYSVS